MTSVVESVALMGVEGRIVTVEVSLVPGVPSFTIVGLPDASVREARDRVRAAICSAHFTWPKCRITVNLSPASLPKTGSWFDLPIALGVLVADLQLDHDRLDGRVVIGELALSGAVRGVPGALCAALCAKQNGRRGIVLPAANAAAGHDVGGLEIAGVGHLADLARELPCSEPPPATAGGSDRAADGSGDFGEVVGQEAAKLGLEVAAAGNHHCLLVGEPGSGKSMLARRLGSIMPPLADTERLEASLVHSIASADAHLVEGAPVRSPHHSASVVSLVGGGTRRVVPGEASLAHCGILHLDELGEFKPAALNALRQPLEDGAIQVVRANMRVALPARFLLVASTNPCPCGYAGSARQQCACDATALAIYRRRLNGPLLDRFGMTIPVNPVAPDRVLSAEHVSESPAIRERVCAARTRQARRLGPGRTNATMTAEEVRRAVRLTTDAQDLLAAHAESTSTRALMTVQKVARTIADLDAREVVRESDIRLAWRLRAPELAAWGEAA